MPRFWIKKAVFIRKTTEQPKPNTCISAVTDNSPTSQNLPSSASGIYGSISSRAVHCCKSAKFQNQQLVIHSAMCRTGYFNCSNPLLNQLFDNVIWGQKGNFVDVPTDCPQRDERLGWTGDAQVFIRTACMNYDAEKILHQMACRYDGRPGPGRKSRPRDSRPAL